MLHYFVMYDSLRLPKSTEQALVLNFSCVKDLAPSLPFGLALALRASAVGNPIAPQGFTLATLRVQALVHSQPKANHERDQNKPAGLLSRRPMFCPP